MTPNRYDRRSVLAGGLGAALALGLAKSKSYNAEGRRIVETAASVHPAGSDLGAVEHVVFLMHENRSFDHYYGVLGGVNGFDANSTAFAQAWPGGAASTLLPFHLDTTDSMAECTYDLSHSWQAEHASWDDGAMDSFVSTHTSTSYEGPELGTLTMGYYESTDIPFYYDLIQNFTVCDAYHCSVLGPTHPNRLLQMTGTLDPAGVAGGPVLVTNSDEALEFTCSWTTMPEVLTDAGVSWKVYNPYGANYTPGSALSMTLCKNVLMYFDQYQQSVNPTLYQNAFGYYGPNVPSSDSGLTGGKGPDNFAADVKNDQLPAVSWIIPPDGYDEHPPAPAVLGEWYTRQVLKTLMSNKEVWASTVLFIMYDENDGWFDHVPPPTAPAGTTGEYVTASSDSSTYTGPIGLGIRVPMLVVSPFSAGGWVCSDTFDHTSQLQFLATRFGVTVPNVSSWRAGTVGDLTSTLPTLGTPITKKPVLPKVSPSIKKPPIEGECTSGQLIEVNPTTSPYPVPTNQTQPTQGPDTLKPTPT
ncbi:MAG TPA: alkaline phosphatase family protein [Acidimicrobiales bacterium]|nr:alkaline phosphatase family protein [Acidimicrobiales bacterium]